MSTRVQGLHRWLGASAGLFGLAAVFLAALGAHLVEFSDHHAIGLWETALKIHLFHAAALLALTALCFHMSSPALSAFGLLMALGTLLFSGSLYLRASGWEFLPGFVAPTGGLMMMAAWLGITVVWLKKP